MYSRIALLTKNTKTPGRPTNYKLQKQATSTFYKQLSDDSLADSLFSTLTAEFYYLLQCYNFAPLVFGLAPRGSKEAMWTLSPSSPTEFSSSFDTLTSLIECFGPWP